MFPLGKHRVDWLLSQRNRNGPQGDGDICCHDQLCRIRKSSTKRVSVDSAGLHSWSGAVQSCRSSAQPCGGCSEGHLFIALQFSLLGRPAELEHREASVLNLQLALLARVGERRCGQEKEVELADKGRVILYTERKDAQGVDCEQRDHE